MRSIQCNAGLLASLAFAVAIGAIAGCGNGYAETRQAIEKQHKEKNVNNEDQQADAKEDKQLEQLVVAGGCFWCVEGVFEQLDGVTEAVSGYSGGKEETANYRAVCTGNTGHAEAVRLSYDPDKISFEKLLEIFFTVAHDPTQLNRQGPDVGPQYRSAIFFADEDERKRVQNYIDALRESKAIKGKIVTTLEPLENFYVAEDYHQDYVQCNLNNPYVNAHALPKIDKVRKEFEELIRE